MYYGDLDTAITHAHIKAFRQGHDVSILYHFDKDEYVVTNDPGQFEDDEVNQVMIMSPDGEGS